MTQRGWSPASGIAAEKDALRGFISLLTDEQNILLGTDTEALLTLSENKTATASALMRMIEERHAFAAAHHISHWPEWLAAHHPDLSDEWLTLARLSEQAQNLNKTNGELIQIRLRHNQLALSVLNKAAQKAELYGPDGGHSNAGGSGRTFGAA